MKKLATTTTTATAATTTTMAAAAAAAEATRAATATASATASHLPTLFLLLSFLSFMSFISPSTALLSCHLYTIGGQSNCTSVQGCCWSSATATIEGIEPPAGGFNGHCKICVPLVTAEKDALEQLWQAWEYPVQLPDAIPEEILCPHQGLVMNARVNCDDEGHINDLLLGNDFLYGKIESLCLIADNFLQMEVLSLAGNELWGELPNCLAKMTGLSTLFINHNFLHGTLPNLAGMTKIIDATQCGITSVKDDYHLRHDTNCFECGPNWDLLPAACYDDDKFGFNNQCQFFQGQSVPGGCPDPIIPTRSPTPASGLISWCKNELGSSCYCATMNCACDPVTGECGPGLKCEDDYCTLADPPKEPLPAWAIALIAIAALLILLGVCIIIYCLLRDDEDEDETSSKRGSRTHSRSPSRHASRYGQLRQSQMPGGPVAASGQYGPAIMGDATASAGAIYSPATAGGAYMSAGSTMYSPANQGEAYMAPGTQYGAATMGGESGGSYGSLSLGMAGGGSAGSVYAGTQYAGAQTQYGAASTGQDSYGHLSL